MKLLFLSLLLKKKKKNTSGIKFQSSLRYISRQTDPEAFRWVFITQTNQLSFKDDSTFTGFLFGKLRFQANTPTEAASPPARYLI